MTYGQVKNQVLKLLNQYTVAGTPVPETYNNQADYIARIPELVNDAMLELSTTVRKIQAVVGVASCSITDMGQQLRVAMPDNFFQFPTGNVFRTKDGWTFHTQHFMMRGMHYVLLPKDEVDVENDSHQFIYYRYPILLSEDPEDEDVLDNVEEVHRAIPYYVAGTLAMHDDPFLSATLMNGYEDKLNKMLPDITAEAAPVQDAYAFYCCGYEC